MKILFNAVSAKSGGAATYIRNLSSSLANASEQHQYIFLVPVNLGQAIQSKSGRLKVKFSDISYKPAWRRFLWDQFTLRRIVRKEKIDLLVSSSDFGMLFPPCPQILMIRNPLFFSTHFLQKILLHKSRRFRAEFLIRRWLIALSTRWSKIIITATRSMLDDVRRMIRIPDHKTAINSFGVPLERFLPQQTAVVLNGTRNGDNERFQILYVSEYSDYKNLTTLLKAVQILRQKGVDSFRVVTTAHPLQFPAAEVITRHEDQALMSHPMVAPFISFTGFVPYEQIPTLYAQSDLFVFPSLAESFGHPLVEAMASELPILASDIPICREICSDAAVYFDPLDSAELAEAILGLWSNPELRSRLGRAGKLRAIKHFDWRDHVRRLLEIFRVMAEGLQGKTDAAKAVLS